MFGWFTKTRRNLRRLNDLSLAIENIREEMDALRSKMDVSDEIFDRFQADRKSPEYLSVFEKKNPLVSVCVATYNRGRLLVERSLRSILNQEYRNLDVIVVGDCCTDDTAALVSKIRDERLRFVNLPKRGEYPENPEWRWMVAGTTPINHALNLSEGDFITQLDDDDEYTLDRIQKLVAFMKQTRADFVWHPFWTENDDGKWSLNETREFKIAQTTTSSVLYHRWLAQVPWDINAYKYREPGDWNRFRKIKYLGVKALRYHEPLLKHYKQKNQRSF